MMRSKKTNERKDDMKIVEQGTFVGIFLYDYLVPKDHFLRKLREEIDWKHLGDRFWECYKGGGEYGPPPYPPEIPGISF